MDLVVQDSSTTAFVYVWDWPLVGKFGIEYKVLGPEIESINQITHVLFGAGI